MTDAQPTPAPPTLRRTPLYDMHRQLGAKMVEFGGWEMPVQYSTGIIEEHRAVRVAAGLFDVSHMGEIEIRGPGAMPFLRRVVSNDPADLQVGQAQYALLTYPNGGTVDDLIVYRLGEQDYMAVVNASNREKDFAWLRQQVAGATDVEILDRSDDYALLALQGPRSAEILQPLADVDLTTLKYYHFHEGRVAGHPALISATGYTGELGYEIMVSASEAVDVWHALLKAGADKGLKPAGLGARDTLRLEAAMPLYGHELDQDTNAIEAGLGRFVNLDKGDFTGRQPIAQAKEQGPAKRLVGFEMIGRGIPRSGYPIVKDGATVGVVTSGTQSPTLGRAIGMAYVRPGSAQPGTEFDVIIRGTPVPARVVKRPFYRRPR